MIDIKEMMRDLLAFGSIPFYAIVIVRAAIGKYMPFVYHLIFALIVLGLVSLLIPKTNQYIARGLILTVFTSLFYKDIAFTFFVGLLWIFMCISSYKIKDKNIVVGTLVGIFSIAIASGIATLII